MTENPDFNALLASRRDLLRSLAVEEGAEALLAEFLTRIWQKNRDLNLVSRKMPAETLVDNHLIDCLIALPHLPVAERAADLGSGGGFPGVVLAICRPQTQFRLFEKSPLKRRFLESLTDLTTNIEIDGLIESGDALDGFDWVTARAFKPIATMLQLVPGYLHQGGRFELYKGRREAIENELAVAGIPQSRVKITRLNPLGGAEERHLVSLFP